MTSWHTDRNVGNAALGQFATRPSLADLLLSRVRGDVRTAIDLGCGPGALTQATERRFNDARVTMVDVDAVGRHVAAHGVGRVFLRRSVLAATFARMAVSQFGAFDLAVANPPFLTVRQRPPKYLTRVFPALMGASIYRAELAFLVQALACVRDNGVVAMFMPRASLRSAPDAELLTSLMRDFGLTEIIKLPARAFRNAEVECVALVFNRGQERRKVRLYSLTPADLLLYEGWKTAAEVSAWLDELTPLACAPASTTLTGLGADAKRGKQSAVELRALTASYFHTTSFGKSQTQLVEFAPPAEPWGERLVVARPGDILIPRVGRRMDKSAIVLSGGCAITDCVFMLRTPEKITRKIWEFISSEHGVQWRESLMRGSCAKFIPQARLLAAPLPASFQP